MTANLLMIVPSRGRPHNVSELCEAWAATTTGAADLMVVVDADDPMLDEYGTANRTLLPHQQTVLPERLRLGPTLNAVAEAEAGRYRAVGFMGDDHRPRTVGWDARYLQALDDMGTGIVYGNDLLQGPNLPTQVAMTSDIVTTLGWICPPGMVHMWLDNVWLDLGQGIDRLRYLPDVIVEHMHYSAGKSGLDQGYVEVNAPEAFEQDRLRYEDWRRLSKDADVARLRELVRRG